MSEKFIAKMQDPKVVGDMRTLADFFVIWCDGNHRDRARSSAWTEGAQQGIYGRKKVVLCEECESHLAYAEKRRAYCPKDPKPFCAYCDTHCYRPAEREWERRMMRYSGPKSWRKGHAIDGIRHALDGRKFRRDAKARARGPTATDRQATDPTIHQEEAP